MLNKQVETLYDAECFAKDQEAKRAQANSENQTPQTVTFSVHSNGYYVCDKPGGCAGEYVRLADVMVLVEALNKIHSWLVCAAICSHDDMAQSFEDMEETARLALEPYTAKQEVK